ncbi:MAG: VOC family protein [Dehalococcoidia bacterium]
MPQTTGLGHVGIYAEDFMGQRDFYTRVMGLKIADENLERGMCFMSTDPVAEHHEFVIMKGREADADTKVIQQISFKVPTIQDLREYKAKLEAEENVTIERIVSHGNAFGMYFFDPEGNRIELYYRTGMPVPQPHGDLIDLDRTDEELLADARHLLLTKEPTK